MKVTRIACSADLNAGKQAAFQPATTAGGERNILTRTINDEQS